MIDFDNFLEWAKNHFGEENIKLKHTKRHGTEICANSPFALKKLGKFDNKFHLWMNPRKKDGVYRCWLTDEMGSLVGLVSKLDGISYEDAEELLQAALFLRNLESKIHEFFGVKEEEKIEAILPTLPPYSFLIDEMSPSSRYKIHAVNYLRKRKIPTAGLYMCVNGDYKNRIIIPYYDRHGKIIWFNARTLSEKDNVLRYMKPEVGSQEDVLYMTNWNLKSKVYIMEGEFDAMTVGMCNVTACACGGKHLSPSQIELLRGCIPVLAFDADSAGLSATIDIGTDLLSAGFKEMYYVRPPKAFKDWNALLQHKDIETVKAYIEKWEKPLNSLEIDRLRFAA